MKIALALLVMTASAYAEPRHAVSVQLATLDTTGINVQGETDLGRRKLSLAVAIGARGAAEADYKSSTVGIGVELRRWLRRPTTMGGLYAGVRTDLARTSLTDLMDDRGIGGITTWTLGATLGYRFLIRQRVELTPSVGAGLVVEGGASPTTARRAGTVGLTAGIAF
jgi:hypothetical protein